MGVLSTGQARKNGGLRHGSGKKGGSLLRLIPVLDIYVSAPPPPPGTYHGLININKGCFSHHHS